MCSFRVVRLKVSDIPPLRVRKLSLIQKTKVITKLIIPSTNIFYCRAKLYSTLLYQNLFRVHWPVASFVQTSLILTD